MNKSQFIFSFLALMMFSCKSIKNDLGTYEGEKLTIGFGGGIAGTTTEYIVLKSGECYKKPSGSSEYEYLRNLDKNSVKQIFNNYYILGIKKETINDPGNKYSFLRYENKNEKYQQTWGGNNHPVPDNIEKLYKQILRLVSNLENTVK